MFFCPFKSDPMRNKASENLDHAVFSRPLLLLVICGGIELLAVQSVFYHSPCVFFVRFLGCLLNFLLCNDIATRFSTLQMWDELDKELPSIRLTNVYQYCTWFFSAWATVKRTVRYFVVSSSFGDNGCSCGVLTRVVHSATSWASCPSWL